MTIILFVITGASAAMFVGTTTLLIRSLFAADEWKISYASDGADAFTAARGTLSWDHIDPQPGGTRDRLSRASHYSTALKQASPPQQYPHRKQWHGFVAESVQQLDVNRYYIIEAAPRRIRQQFEADIEKQRAGPDRIQSAIFRQRLLLAVSKWQRVKMTNGSRDSSTRWRVTIPGWPVALAAFVVPALVIPHRIRRYLWRKQGRCLMCGYNLTGNVSGICPKCGAACKAADPAGASTAAGDG